MSGNVAKPKVEKTDRRVRRTRDTLGDALFQLMHEKTFDDITVQEVLDRAGVGRSTFYTHYRDKDDLFLSDVEDLFAMFSAYLTRTQASIERLVPVSEFFAHVGDVQVFYKSMVASGKIADVKELGVGFFARSIEERLRMAGVEMEPALSPAQMAAQAHALAGSLFALLDWWLDHGMKPEPKEMDALFHRMAWNGIRPLG